MFKIKPTPLYRKEGLYFSPVHPKGRGVFCEHDIKAGELIEVAPVFLFNEEDTKNVGKTILADYYFSAENLPEAFLRREGITDPKQATCMAVGVMSYCNHMADPNAKTEKITEHYTVYYKLIALKEIARDVEIGINYGLSWLTFRRLREQARTRPGGKDD